MVINMMVVGNGNIEASRKKNKKIKSRLYLLLANFRAQA